MEPSEASACNFTKSNTPSWVLFKFCTNGTKLPNASLLFEALQIFLVIPTPNFERFINLRCNSTLDLDKSMTYI